MSKFYSRTTSDGMYKNPLWYDSRINPYAGSAGLPNCTCYAYGRFMESAGKTRCSLPLGDGGAWWGSALNSGVYQTGSSPQLGAVVCYGQKGRSGHVAIVEGINNDGTFIISQSGWIPRDQIPAYPPDSNQYFWLNTCSASSKMPAWMSGRGYYFQGFIYNPDSGGIPITNNWKKGNRWLNRSEQENNAAIVWKFLIDNGWSENAAAAILGNMQVESTINPGIWENLVVNPQRGFGLVQWTPSTKLTNWIHATYPGMQVDNGDFQLARLIYELDNGLQWGSGDVNPPFKMTFREFTVSDKNLFILTGAFMKCYERPLNQSAAAIRIRTGYSEDWYRFFTGKEPPKGFPVWLLFKMSKGVKP